MSDVNLFEVSLNDEDDDPPGYHALYERIGPLLGAEQLGLSVYELPPACARTTTRSGPRSG